MAYSILPQSPSFVIINATGESQDNHHGSNRCKESTASHEDEPKERMDQNDQQQVILEESDDSNISVGADACKFIIVIYRVDNIRIDAQRGIYISLVAWFSVCLVPMQYYFGSIGFQLEEKGDDDGFYTSLFTIVYAVAALVAPLGGMFSDRLGLGWAQGDSTLFVAASFFVLASRGSFPVQVVGLVCYRVGRMFVFGFYFGNIGKRFGYAHYGTLSGIGLFLSAIVSLLQYPLLAAAADGHSVKASVGIGLVCLILYCVWLTITERQIPMAQTFWIPTRKCNDDTST